MENVKGFGERAVKTQQNYPQYGGNVTIVFDSVIPLFNIKKIIDSLTIVERVEVLPYHNLGVHKYEGLGIEYTLKDVPMPETEQVDEARKILGAI